MQQGRFGEAGLGRSGKVTRREQFLDRMEQGVPWARFEQLIVVHYPVAGRGRRPVPIGGDAADPLYAAMVWSV